MITMTRRATFAAAHADWLPNLSHAENQARFGAKASPEPHGHNFVLDVTVRGRIDPKTGMVLNIKTLDRVMRERIIDLLANRFINRQVPHFYQRPATLENLTDFIAMELAPALPPEARLTRLRLEETPERWASWEQTSDKESKTMYLTHVYEFAASHRLHSPHLSDQENREVFGKCNYENGHGHNYLLEVTLTGPVDPRSGRVIDPEMLDAIVHREVVARYDHRHFNFDVPEFEGCIPTAEVITQVIWNRLRDQIPAPVRLHSVLLRETARSIFEYRGEDEILA
jgi:6-pyruvoyltetrahydropterin/6-carboxytetrahydropterin synthase